MTRPLSCLIGVLMATLMFSAPAPADEDAKLAAFFRRYLDDEMKHRPSEATRLGDHRYDHLLDDLSPKARAEGESRLRRRGGIAKGNRLRQTVAGRSN